MSAEGVLDWQDSYAFPVWGKERAFWLYNCGLFMFSNW